MSGTKHHIADAYRLLVMALDQGREQYDAECNELLRRAAEQCPVRVGDTVEACAFDAVAEFARRVWWATNVALLPYGISDGELGGQYTEEGNIADNGERILTSGDPIVEHADEIAKAVSAIDSTGLDDAVALMTRERSIAKDASLPALAVTLDGMVGVARAKASAAKRLIEYSARLHPSQLESADAVKSDTFTLPINRCTKWSPMYEHYNALANTYPRNCQERIDETAEWATKHLPHKPTLPAAKERMTERVNEVLRSGQ